MPTRLQLDFAAAWLKGNPCLLTSWIYCNPPLLTRDLKLTPAGSDLLATIEALGIDPTTARADDDPDPVEERAEQACAKCGGTGEIPVIGRFTNPCGCKARLGYSGTYNAKSTVQAFEDEPFEVKEGTKIYLAIDTGRTTTYSPELQNIPPERPLNHGKQWSRAGIRTLRKLHDDGASICFIADYLGRSERSIECKLAALGVASQASLTKCLQGAVSDRRQFEQAFRYKRNPHKPDPNPPGFGEDSSIGPAARSSVGTRKGPEIDWTALIDRPSASST